MPKWADVLSNKLLEQCGKSCANARQLAAAVSEEIGEAVAYDALFNAHRRYAERLKLKASLQDYLGQRTEPKNKPPKISLTDLRFPLSEKRRKEIARAKRVVVTAALNNCPIDKGVWQSILGYAKHNKAAIVVLPIRYKNPTTQMQGKELDGPEYWWPQELMPYLTDELIQLHEKFWIMGHVSVQATVVHPLVGLEDLSRGSSAVFGHGQLSMRMVPTPQHKLPKVLYTTGSISEPRYSSTKAGIRGNFHHGKGGVVIELDGPRFHIRALVADDDSSFYDIDRYYHPKGSKKSPGALGLVTGDEHALFADLKCKKATFTAKNSIVRVTKPAHVIRHDVFDGYSISHHGRKDVVTQIAKHRAGVNGVLDELELTVRHIDSTTPEGVKNLIVSSNHHDHLLRWLKETTPLDEPWNADAWISLWASLKDTIRMGDGGAECADPFALWAKPRLKSETEFLSSDSDRTIGGIGIGLHGHNGANGARGSLRSFARLGLRTITAHSHTPGIEHGAYRVGTSSQLKLEYTRGPSSWAHCHCLIHPNGKRQLLFVIEGKWRR